VAFLRRLNELVYGQHPGCFTIAEESTAWPAVSQPAWLGGLGFGFKWNMGWMHDSLHYFARDPVHRAHHHNELTFSMLYAFTENFVLPLSHDEVVHGKGSLLGKMPGDRWQQFANLRLLLTYFWTHPGKKLLFMGTELAPDREWDHDRGLEWHLVDDPPRAGFLRLMEDLGRLYRGTPALWELDHGPEGFSWIDCQDAAQGVVSFIRRGCSSHLVVILNLTPVRATVTASGLSRGASRALSTDSRSMAERTRNGGPSRPRRSRHTATPVRGVPSRRSAIVWNQRTDAPVIGPTPSLERLATAYGIEPYVAGQLGRGPPHRPGDVRRTARGDGP
jgi:1,4-alpha-glucan branching enzyme